MSTDLYANSSHVVTRCPGVLCVIVYLWALIANMGNTLLLSKPGVPLVTLFWLNTQYMTNSTLVSPVKMEYGWNFSISGLKMMMKSGLGKIFLKFLHALNLSFLLLNFDQGYKFSNKNNMVSACRNFKNIFPRPLFIIIFRPEMLKFTHIPFWPGIAIFRFVCNCVF